MTDLFIKLIKKKIPSDVDRIEVVIEPFSLPDAV